MPDEKMVPMFGKGLSGELPSRIADLSSIANDLRFAEEVFLRLCDRKLDDVANKALWEAGVIAYRRGFASGRALLWEGKGRTRIPDEIVKSLPPDLRHMHDDLLDQANRHIAHRVDDREQVVVMLLLRNPLVGRAVEGVGLMHARFVGPMSDVAEKGAQLARLLRQAADKTLETLQLELTKVAQSKGLDWCYEDAETLGSKDPQTE